jgi:O-succinylbenzoic acid--CoA ligase
MLITDHLSWDHATFEAHIQGMCRQIEAFPHERVAFWAPSTPEVILAFFACWKMKKIACPLSPRLPSAQPALDQLGTELFTPRMPEAEFPAETSWDLQQHATLLFTSGTMGRPKIACHTLGNLVASAQGSNELIPLQPSDRWALTLPLFHIGGLGTLFRCYLAKCSVLASANWESATHLSLVPTQLYRLMKEPKLVPSLKTILLGGAPFPDLKTPSNIIPTYGMTEMSSQIVTGHQIHPYAEVKIADDNEIWVRGPVLFQGYYEKGKGLTLPLQDGWFATNDFGCWKGKKFHFLGRKDNLFISGGENIQPEEIEEVIRSVCGLQEAVVVPIADEEFGARPVVFLKDPQHLAQLQTMLKEHLPKYKIPIKAFVLPEQTGLKLNRKALADKLSLPAKS